MRIAVFGSAHLDILATVGSHAETVDKPGSLAIAYGGTGHNVAVNLAALGHEVVFVTAMSESLISRSVVEAMRAEGVAEVLVDNHPGLPEAGFSAHIVDGEMVSAVSSMPVDRVRLDGNLVAGALAGAVAAVAECNLTVETLRDIAAAARQVNVTLYLAAVSQAKSLKLLGIPRGTVRAVFMNQRELDYLLSSPGPHANGCDLAARLGCTVVETRSEHGVRLWPRDFGRPMTFAPKGIAHKRRAGDHWLGAGDHLMALALHKHHGEGISFPLAVVAASRYVSRHHGRRGCHVGAENPLEDRLRSLTDTAHRDRLTGLLNRAGLDYVLSGLAPAAEGALIMIDIDHFKQVNDVHGHDAGDRVLRGVAQVFAGSLRASDAVVRWGGEEMLAILPGTDLATAAAIAERIRSSVETAPLDPSVTISLGVATGRIMEIDKMRDSADCCLYEAKKSGRNKVVAASQELEMQEGAAA